jgi:hypothetical protein
MKTTRKQTAKEKPEPSAAELLDEIRDLARKLKEIDGYYNHGVGCHRGGRN